MAIRLTEHDGGKTLEVQVSGKLAHQDYQRFVPEFENMAKKHGKIRVLFEMVDFHGWKAAALWDDIRFDLKHLSDIERLALVGDKKWEKGMSVFCRPFTTAEVRYFDRAAIDLARAWVDGTRRERASLLRATEDNQPSTSLSRNQVVVGWGAMSRRKAQDHGIVKSAFKIVPQPAVLRVFQTKDQTRAFYNKMSRVYDLLADRSEAPVRRAGLSQLKPRAGEKVLEIGFATGHSLVQIAKAVGPNGRVFGLDLSNKMLKWAKINVSKAGMTERVRLRCGDAAHLPYADRCMDAVFMSFTLELFDTPEIPQVLDECKRVLRSGGRILVVGMSKEGKHDPLVGVFEWAHRHFPNFLDCRPIYVRRALEEAGFRIVKALTKHLWIPAEVVLGMKVGSQDCAPVSPLGQAVIL